MLHDLDDALKDLLIKEVPIDINDIDISFDAPKKEWSTTVSKPTINLYLYDLRQNLELREEMNAWLLERDREEGRGIRRKMPARIDASYLITAWTGSVDDEHRLLWRVMETLFRFKELPEEYQRGELKTDLVPIKMKTAQIDGVLKNPAEFWSALDNQLKPSVSLQVTLPLLDYKVSELRPLRLVKSRTYRFIKLKENIQEHRYKELTLYGLVKSVTGDPLEGAIIKLTPLTEDISSEIVKSMEEAIESLGRISVRTMTDKDGFYYFLGIKQGLYRIEAFNRGYKSFSQDIEIFPEKENICHMELRPKEKEVRLKGSI